MAEEKVNVKKPFKGAKVDWPADMPDDMLEDVITVAKKALEEHEFEEEGVEIAKIVKQHMDEKWEPYWHVFLGKSFGCYSVHERNRFVYFSFE
jgi:dynein light chain LC8-type